jgi:hypothetical protein
MRLIVMVFGLHALDTRTSRPPIFSCYFNDLQRFPTITISSVVVRVIKYWDINFCAGLPRLPPWRWKVGMGEKGGMGMLPALTPTLALPHQGGG